MRAPRPASGLPLVLAAALGCTPPSRPSAGDAERPQVVLHEVRYYGYEGTELSALGEARRAAFQRTSGVVLAAEVLLRLPSPGTGEGQLGPRAMGVELRAAEVEGSLGGRQGEARGGVSVRTAAGEAGHTARAAFDGAARRVQGPEPVTVSAPGWRLEAQRFALDFADRTYVFEGEVRTQVGAAQ